MKRVIFIVLILNSFFSVSQELLKEESKDSSNVEVLEEIKIVQSKRKAGVYKLQLPKEILKNETLDKTLRRIENITLDSNKMVYFKGRKVKNYIYNDKVITQEEFFKLLSENIVFFQIITNYFNLSTGETELVIKVIDNQGAVNKVKGSIDATLGLLQEFNFYGFNLFFKRNKFSTILNASYLKNITENSSKEIYNSNALEYSNHRVLYQPYLSMLNIYEIDKSSTISLRNKFSMVDENRNSIFPDSSVASFFFLIRDYNMNLRYEKRTENKMEYKLNLDYILNDNKIENTINKSKQQFIEWTFGSEISKTFQKLYIQSALVLTYRHYTFDNTLNRSEVEQKVVTPFLGFNLDINNNNSLVFGNRFQFYEDKVDSDVAIYNNSFYLPNFSYFSKLESIADIEFNYKRYIVRPSVRSISNFTYKDFNNNLIESPSYIKPEVNDAFSLEFVKDVKKVNVTLELGYLASKNNISVVNKLNGYNMVSQNVNLDEYNNVYVGSSVSFKFFKESRFNLNYRFTEIKMRNGTENHNGRTNYFDLSISGNINSETFYSFNSYYIDRFYDFNLYRSVKPDLSFSVSRNFLKEKINVNLEYRNILNTDANRVLRFRDNNNYYVLDNKNVSNMILLNVSYNFGRSFKTNRKFIRNINLDMKP